MENLAQVSIAAEGSDGRSASVPESSAGRSAASSAMASVESEQAVDGRSASTAESGACRSAAAPARSVVVIDVENSSPEGKGESLVEEDPSRIANKLAGGSEAPSSEVKLSPAAGKQGLPLSPRCGRSRRGPQH